MRKITIVIQAIPFCFGPGAQALAIGNQLRLILGKKLKLIALGTGTTYEFLKKSKTFDTIYEYSSEENIPKRIESLLLSADKIVCIGDFEFINKVHMMGKKVEFVDPLFWMWNKFPSNMNHCNKYYAVDFPGVKERIKEYNKEFPKSLAPTIVNQICEYGIRRKKKNYDTVIVQFGGIQNPLGTNIDLIVAMIEEISNSIKKIQNLNKVLIRGGSKAMNIVRSRIKNLDPRIKIGTQNHENFLKELSSCKVLLTVPGMSIVYEAFAGKIPLMFILPLNYSQHRQLIAYKKIFKNFEYLSWEHFKGYKTLPEKISEEKAINEAINMGKHFFNDVETRIKFREKITKFLFKKRYKIMTVKKNNNRIQKVKINGAKGIAKDLTKEILHRQKRTPKGL